MSKRAKRRHHLRRMKKRAREVFYWHSDPKRAERYANHMAMCSRACCGNPRHWLKGEEKITRTEQKSNLDFGEQLKEG